MKVIVIGAGVAGLFFASFLENHDITVIDKNEFAGRKLLATGNGRCNFTNLNYGPRFFYGKNKDLISYVIDYYTNHDLIEFFNGNGVLTTNLPSGRCYPITMSSKTIKNSLLLKASENAKFILNQEVIDIDFDKKDVKTKDRTYSYDKLVIATGGVSLKNSGSDGKIFDLIKNRISLTPMTYGITNFKTKKTLSKKAKGTKVTAKASLLVDNRELISSIDDVIFQSYGITGTAILDISNDISIALSNDKRPVVEIDLFPEYTNKEFKSYLLKLFDNFPQRKLKEILQGILNEKLIGDMVKISGLKENIPCGKLREDEIDRLIRTLKELRFEITNIHDKENAQVTLGGVDTRYINKETMESTEVEDVFFIGECQDVAGACGGYNISWAAASAKIAADYIRSLNV